jgi:hypothetical protein
LRLNARLADTPDIITDLTLALSFIT